MTSDTGALGTLAGRVRDEVGKALVGQAQAVDGLLIGLVTGGHVLLEGVPGTAKTLMARCLAHVLDATFKRIQFSPDLMPADVVGTNVYDASSQTFSLRKGPVFANLVLADEINRTPPKTQAALLEAMQEGQVTIDGVTHALPEPFMVVATQNPVEYEGTYPLPSSRRSCWTTPAPTRSGRSWTGTSRRWRCSTCRGSGCSPSRRPPTCSRPGPSWTG